jgi:hypothetical protein
MRSLRLPAAVALACLALCAAASAAQDPGPSVHSLLREARDLKADVADKGLTLDARLRAEKLGSALDSLGSGAPSALDDLGPDPATLDLSRRLDAVIATLELAAEGPQRPAQEPEILRDKLHAILASGGYSIRRPDVSQLDALRRRLKAVLRSILDALGQSAGAVKSVSRIFLLTVLALMAAVAAVVIARFLQARARFRRSRGAAAPVPTVAVTGSPEAERALAARLARDADFRGALHHTFLALLADLERLGLVTPDRSRTNREYVLQFASRGADGRATAVLCRAVRFYDDKWYGGASCTREDVALLDGEAASILEGVGQSPAQAR